MNGDILANPGPIVKLVLRFIRGSGSWLGFGARRDTPSSTL